MWWLESNNSSYLQEQLLTSNTPTEIKEAIFNSIEKAEKKLEAIMKSPEKNPDFYQKCKKDYEILQDIILSALETENSIVAKELDMIKSEVMLEWQNYNWKERTSKEWLIKKNKVTISKKTKENVKWNIDNSKDIWYYAENPDLLSLIDDGNFLLKIIEYAKNKNKNITESLGVEYSHSIFNLENLNPKFRWDINIIKNLPIEFNYQNLILINQELLKNPNNVIDILWKDIYDITKFFLILLNIHWKDNILNFLSSVFKNNKLKKEISEYYNLLPLSIQKLDTNNKFNLNNEDWELSRIILENNNDSDIKSDIQYLLKYNIIEQNDLNYEKILKINTYIQSYWIDEIKDELKLLLKKWFLKHSEILKDFIWFDKEIAILAIKEDKTLIPYIPINIRSDYEFNKEFLNAKNEEEKTTILNYINYIELNSTESIIVLYKLIKNDKNRLTILSNIKIRSQILNVLEKKEYVVANSKENTLIKKIYEDYSIINEESKKLKKIKKKINNNDLYNTKTEELLNKNIWEEKWKKIMQMLKINKDIKEDIYHQLLESCHNKPEKTKELIKKLLDIKIEETKNKGLNLETNYSINYNKTNEEIKKSKNDFFYLLTKEKKENWETKEQFTQRIIEKFFKENKINNELEKESLREIFKNELELRENQYKKENIDDFVWYLSWKITKEEFEEELFEEIKNLDNFNNKDIIINNWTINNISYQYQKWSDEIFLGEEKIDISQKDKELMKNNPEIIKEIVNFYSILETVWLTKLWNKREMIFTSLSNVYWGSFKLDWNYLNKNEVKIFLNSILVSTWHQEIKTNSLQELISKIEVINQNQVTTWANKTNVYWFTKLEKIFRDKFFNKNWNLWFKKQKFEDSLRKKT